MKKSLIAMVWLMISLASLSAVANDGANEFIMGAGVHTGQLKLKLNSARPVMDWAGIKSVRQEVYWHRLELSKGDLRFPDNLNEVEKFVDYVNAKGGKPLLILNYGNKFYDEGDLVHSPEAIEAFARYAKFVAAHFKGKVQLYEVWNEWNIGLGSPKKPRTNRSAATYVSVLKATYKVLKQVDPKNVVIGGVVAGVDKKGWTDAFISAGGLPHLDAFSLHPYVMWSMESKPENAIEWVDQVHQNIAKAEPKRNIPIYVTEIGWPSHESKISWKDEQIADFLIRFHLLARSRPYIKGVWWYELVNGGRARDDKEKTFGLVDADFGARAALRAYRVVSYLFANARSVVINEGERGERITWEARMQDGSYCRGHWVKSEKSFPNRYKLPAYEGSHKILWGNPAVLNETPYVGCEVYELP